MIYLVIPPGIYIYPYVYIGRYIYLYIYICVCICMIHGFFPGSCIGRTRCCWLGRILEIDEMKICQIHEMIHGTMAWSRSPGGNSCKHRPTIRETMVFPVWICISTRIFVVKF